MRALKVLPALLFAITGAIASNTHDSLTIVIFNSAGVSHSTLLSAVQEGRHALHVAGVETEWILCNLTQPCLVPERFALLKILERPVKTTPVSAHGMAATLCTTANGCAGSYVFYDRVEQFADEVAASPELTLAYVMLHEFGHLMGLGHKPGGIMTAHFTSHDMRMAATGWLGFADDDARELRASARAHSNNGARLIEYTPRLGDLSE